MEDEKSILHIKGMPKTSIQQVFGLLKTLTDAQTSLWEMLETAKPVEKKLVVNRGITFPEESS